jgi:hypothetical protein
MLTLSASRVRQTTRKTENLSLTCYSGTGSDKKHEKRGMHEMHEMQHDGGHKGKPDEPKG